MYDSPRINACLEAVCNQGCNTVRATIAALEAGLPVPCMEVLDERERRLVFDELKAIMAVYDC